MTEFHRWFWRKTWLERERPYEINKMARRMRILFPIQLAACDFTVELMLQAWRDESPNNT